METLRTKKQLIAEVAAREAALKEVLSALSARLSAPTTLAGMVAASPLAMRTATHVASTSARKHPVATALLAAAVAWYALRQKANPTPDAKPEALSRWEDEGGQPLDDAAEDAFESMSSDARAKVNAAVDALLARGGKAAAHAKDAAHQSAEKAGKVAVELSEEMRATLADIEAVAAQQLGLARAKGSDLLDQSVQSARKAVAQGETTMRAHPYATAAIGLAIGAGLMAVLTQRNNR